MLVNLCDWHRPPSVAAALRLLRRGRGGIIPAAGMSTLARLANPGITGVLDLTALALAYAKRRSGGLHIGAATTISELIQSPLTKTYAGGMLRQCGGTIGSTLNRNMVTCGGNIVQCYFWSCLPVALLALDAQVVVARGSRRRSLAAAGFFASQPKQSLASDALVTEIILPHLPAGTRAGFRKVAPTATAFAYVTAAALLRRRGQKIAEVRVALGGLTALPQRFPDIEDEYAGRPASDALFAELAARLLDRCRVLPDMRVSADYKQALARSLVADMLIELRDGKTP